MQPIFLVSLRALVRGRRVVVVALLLAVPALLAIAYLAGGQPSDSSYDGSAFAIQLFNQLTLPIFLPLTALIFATSVLGAEVEDRTLVYLTLRPIARWAISTAKLCAAGLVTLVLVEVSLVVTALVATRGAPDGRALGATMLAALAGSVAYSSIFLWLGLIAPRRALLAGLIYVLAWEGLAAGLSSALATFSVRQYLQGILRAALGPSSLAVLTPSSTDGMESVTVVVLVVIAGLLLTTWGLRRIELP